MPEEVASQIFQITLPLPGPLKAINVYLIKEPHARILVDCGMDTPDSWSMLQTELRQIGVALSDLTHIFITHIHPDHIGLVSRVKNASNAEIIMNKSEMFLARERYADPAQLLQQMNVFLARHGVPPDELGDLGWASMDLREFVTLADADIALVGGEELKLGARRWQVLLTPGHSPGHLCLYEPSERILIAGDHLLGSISPHVGKHPQSTANPLQDFTDALQMLYPLEIAVALPGHGPIITDHRARIDTLLGHHTRRKAQFWGTLTAGPKTAYDTSHLIYKLAARQIWDRRLALLESLAHLEALRADGRIEELEEEIAPADGEGTPTKQAKFRQK